MTSSRRHRVVDRPVGQRGLPQSRRPEDVALGDDADDAAWSAAEIFANDERADVEFDQFADDVGQLGLR